MDKKQKSENHLEEIEIIEVNGGDDITAQNNAEPINISDEFSEITLSKCTRPPIWTVCNKDKAYVCELMGGHGWRSW